MLEGLAPFMVGMAGSLHCLGMCGPLILAWSLNSGAGPSLFLHHLAFHSGRITTYSLMGAVAAAIAGSLEVQRFSMQYRGAFLIISAFVLVGLGLVILRALPQPASAVRLISPPPALFGRLWGKLAHSDSLFSKIGLGLLAGLIPCGLTWAVLIVAASTLSVPNGFTVMAVFGLGTLPVLLTAGILASFFSARTRLIGEKAAAVLIVIMGLMLAVRGLGVICGFGDHCGTIELLANLLRP